MRIVVDTSTGNILQVEKTPELGTLVAFNGKSTAPIPEMGAVDISAASYVLPVDGGDVLSEAYASMLAQFPMYNNIVFNPLISALDIAALDLAALFTPTGDITRAMVGRGAGPLPVGHMPNMVAVLAQNNRVSPSRPGVLISDTIDITAATSGLGADEVMVWWHLLGFETTHDVTSSYGATAGQNEPAIRSIVEVNPEPSGFAVYISHDDGANYTQVNRLEPTDLLTYGTALRIAFVNTSNTNTRYMAAYAILF